MNVFTSIQQINAGVKSGQQILQFVLQSRWAERVELVLNT